MPSHYGLGRENSLGCQGPHGEEPGPPITPDRHPEKKQGVPISDGSPPKQGMRHIFVALTQIPQDSTKAKFVGRGQIGPQGLAKDSI